MSFLLLFGLVISFVGYALLRTHLKASRLSKLDWDDLVSRLKPVPTLGISTIARDYLQPSKGQTQIDPADLWVLIGGIDGMQRMYANAEILIALAGYAKRWNFEESVVVAERMRHDGVALRRATLKLSASLMAVRAEQGPFHIQEAASAYYLMRERLLALYETSHAGRYSRLAAAI